MRRSGRGHSGHLSGTRPWCRGGEVSQLREGGEERTRWLELDGFRMGAATQACRARDDVDGGSFQTTMQHGESLPLSVMEPSSARDRVNCGLAAAVSSSRFKVRAAHGCGWRRVRGSNRKEDQGSRLTAHSSAFGRLFEGAGTGQGACACACACACASVAGGGW